MSFLSNMSFNLAVLINLLVAFFYPLDGMSESEFPSVLSSRVRLSLHNIPDLCEHLYLICDLHVFQVH